MPMILSRPLPGAARPWFFNTLETQGGRGIYVDDRNSDAAAGFWS